MAHIEEFIYEIHSVNWDSLTNCEKKQNSVPLLYCMYLVIKIHKYTDLILKYTDLIASDKSGERSKNNNNTLILFQGGGGRIVEEIKSLNYIPCRHEIEYLLLNWILYTQEKILVLLVRLLTQIYRYNSKKNILYL